MSWIFVSFFWSLCFLWLSFLPLTSGHLCLCDILIGAKAVPSWQSGPVYSGHEASCLVTSDETTLEERLRARIGSQYNIDRELGGGGMARVFLATETRLNRRVVEKILPRDTAARVSFERFQREIVLAAGLQNPHIVPVLTAGADRGSIPRMAVTD